MPTKSPTLFLCLAASFALFSGCSTSSPVMASSGGAYTVTKTGTTGFTPLGRLRSQAYEEANDFAESKNMLAEVISVNETPQGFGRWPQVDLKFRLVRPDDRNLKTTKTAVSITTESGFDAMGRQSQSETQIGVTDRNDLYTELKKLGELRDKGLLTEDEFLAKKKQLMEKTKE
jgi:hypothetical protein